MNFVGHIAVGVAADEQAGPHFLFGTALPDFAAMARLRLARTDGALGRGMRVHHATDAVFHRGRWFLDVEHHAYEQLTAAGMARGSALACAHVGVEMLLDGALIALGSNADAVGGVYAVMQTPPEKAIALVPGDQRTRWCEHLTSVAGRLDPSGYADAGTVAARLHRVTATRPRLAFDAHALPAVAEVLADLQPRVVAAAPGVLAGVAGAVRETLGKSRPLG